MDAPEVASEVIDGLLATGKHEVVILSRRVSHGDLPTANPNLDHADLV
jgi:hypothetical protein